jgi:hypothetical protein
LNIAFSQASAARGHPSPVLEKAVKRNEQTFADCVQLSSTQPKNGDLAPGLGFFRLERFRQVDAGLDSVGRAGRAPIAGLHCFPNPAKTV